uniref:Phosphoglucomutase isoform X2 n=1 Tax=Rhizophora mucronata TaxID=61149 RepID=A0A2P2LUC4_RHIMU
MDSKRKASASAKRVDYMTMYASDLVKAVQTAAGNIEKPLEGFHILVDAGNGAGGFFAEKVLEPLGANTSGSQFLEPDGNGGTRKILLWTFIYAFVVKNMVGNR